MNKELIYCRKAPSLGDLEGKEIDTWGTLPYSNNIDAPTVFFGVYGFKDFQALWNHRGQKWILWAGSDIKNLLNGYFLDENGNFRLPAKEIGRWIQQNCESYCENEVEAEALRSVGIDAKVQPSFLGDVRDYKIEYKFSGRPKLYASVSGDDFELYRWDGIENLARENPAIEFHLYGNHKRWQSRHENVFVHGRVTKEKMNEEIKHMQGGLRLLKFDGFSEILAKSVLWGQWPVSAIDYPHMLGVEEIRRLHTLNRPNTEGREHYLAELNKYPWVI